MLDHSRRASTTALAQASHPAAGLARSPDELRELVAPILRASFRDVRFEIFLRDEAGDLAPLDPHGDWRGRRLLSSIRARRAQIGGVPYVLASAEEARGALMSAPLLDPSGEPLGLVAVEAEAGARQFTATDLALLERIATLVSLAIQRLQAAGTVTQRRRELDLSTATSVQRSLMSGTLPPEAGVSAITGYQPALGVGGDFYCLKHLGDGQVGAAIGDVSGNGVSAALVMSRVASDIERAMIAGASPAALLNALNRGLVTRDGEMYVTAACLRVDVHRRRVAIANAGHLPVVVRRADGETYACGGASGMPLGMFPGEYFQEELALEPRDVLVLMTDGLLEALDHPSGHRGLQLLVGEIAASRHDARAVSDGIAAAVERARARHDLDDVTWVCLQLSS